MYNNNEKKGTLHGKRSWKIASRAAQKGSANTNKLQEIYERSFEDIEIKKKKLVRVKAMQYE